MSQPFRTPTGQTGMDAYVYEAAQISNVQRELNARFHCLIDVVRTEQPDVFEHETDFMFRPDATHADHFLDYLQCPR